MRRRPETMFTWSDGWALAYQVWGDGPDLIYLPPFLSSIDMMWQSPQCARFLERLGSFARVVMTDRRGWGTSDRLAPGMQPDLGQLVDDVLTMAATTNTNRPTLLAMAESGFVAIEAVVTHPNSFSGLILFQASPAYTRKDDMPWESSEEDVDANIHSLKASTSWLDWNRTYVRDNVPSLAGDPATIEWFASANRSLSSPGSVVSDIEWSRTLDLRHRLADIGTPALLLTRPDARGWPAESTRYMAERIEGARMVEVEGADHYPWYGDWGSVIDEIQEFVTGSRERPAARRSLTTLLFTDVVGSTARAVELGDASWHALLERHNDLLRGVLRRHGGTEIGTTGDGFFSTFDSPVDAVRCATEMTRAVGDLGLEIRAGLHTGEVEHDGDDLRGVAVHIGARVMSTAGPSEVRVSSTVKDLASGSGLTFEDAGEHRLKGVPDVWRLYRVTT